ncbi:hypothetical protein LXA43DRAFT_1064984 [Ganoderma leucocontextum]|nr:hypothetical protein LXA43DRAFT_1064984 [Ganoderma leucocontextum]
MPDSDALRTEADVQRPPPAMFNYDQSGGAMTSMVFQDPFSFSPTRLGFGVPGGSASVIPRATQMQDLSLLGACSGTPVQAGHDPLMGFGLPDQFPTMSGQPAEGSFMNELYNRLEPAGGPRVNFNSGFVPSLVGISDFTGAVDFGRQHTPYTITGEQLGYGAQYNETDLNKLSKEVDVERSARRKAVEELLRKHKISLPRNVLDIIQETSRNMFGCFEKVLYTDDPDEVASWDLPGPLAPGEERRLAPDGEGHLHNPDWAGPVTSKTNDELTSASGDGILAFDRTIVTNSILKQAVCTYLKLLKRVWRFHLNDDVYGMGNLRRTAGLLTAVEGGSRRVLEAAKLQTANTMQIKMYPHGAGAHGELTRALGPDRRTAGNERTDGRCKCTCSRRERESGGKESVCVGCTTGLYVQYISTLELHLPIPEGLAELGQNGTTRGPIDRQGTAERYGRDRRAKNERTVEHRDGADGAPVRWSARAPESRASMLGTRGRLAVSSLHTYGAPEGCAGMSTTDDRGVSGTRRFRARVSNPTQTGWRPINEEGHQRDKQKKNVQDEQATSGQPPSLSVHEIVWTCQQVKDIHKILDKISQVLLRRRNKNLPILSPENDGIDFTADETAQFLKVILQTIVHQRSRGRKEAAELRRKVDLILATLVLRTRMCLAMLVFSEMCRAIHG